MTGEVFARLTSVVVPGDAVEEEDVVAVPTRR